MATQPGFKLRFDEGSIQEWAKQNTSTDYLNLGKVATEVKKRGHIERYEFLEMCEWKSPRTKSRCASNSKELIEEVTKVAFSSKQEHLKIGVLTLLVGVGWPTASVILHFCDEAKYPILDFRALWSLGIDKPPVYTFPFWWEYIEFCRALADRNNVSMRTLDRALWQYSKKNQRTTYPVLRGETK